MIILFINAHRPTQQGKMRFNTYYKQVKKILKNTIYFGNQVQQIIRNKNQIQDFIFDQINYQQNKKSRQIFTSLQYIFLDGDINILPWTKGFQNLLIFIRNCLRQNKKIHFNGLGHFAAYFYLSTMFDKPYFICAREKITPQIQKKVDYQYDSDTGDLLFRGKKISNSGLKILKQSKRPFSAKSRQAVSNGIVLPTKYHYVIFNSKNGQKILKNVSFPFTFYWKSSILCTSKSISKSKANILVQTQLGNPFAFTYKNSLSTIGLTSQFLQMIQNWLNQSIGRLDQSQSQFQFGLFQTISLDNKLNLKKQYGQFYQFQNQCVPQVQDQNLDYDKDQKKFTLNSGKKSIKSRLGLQSAYSNHKSVSTLQAHNLNKQTPKPLSRPLSSKYNSSINFELVSVRCGDKYQTQQQRYQRVLRQQKSKNFGRSRMMFKGNLQECQIKNYVNLTPGRPVTAHKYRQTDKNKWLYDRNFMLS